MFTRRLISGGGGGGGAIMQLSIRHSRSTTAAIISSPHHPAYASSRNIFSKIGGKPSGAELTMDLQKSKSDVERIDKLRQLNVSHPSQAAMILHSGIIEGKFTGNEYIRQYLSALSKSGKLDKVDMGSLLGVIGRAQGPSGGARGLGAIGGGIGGVGGGDVAGPSGVQGNGTSATNPLYVMNMGGNPSFKSKIPELLLKFITMLVLVSIIYELMSEATSGVGGMGKMAKSAVHKAEKSTKRFDDVLGIDEAKHELQEIVMYLKDPTKFTRLGGKLPAGVLLTGPPGTGKTLLARAIAGEANVPFFYSSGSEFEEMFVGVGAKRVRELFKEAKAHSPCIVFIDEVDAIGGKRNEKDQSTHRMTLNQLLVELDGFEKNSGIIIVAATNFPQSLDPALVRPGRFDKRVNIPTPDIKGRKEILAHYVKGITAGPDVDLEQVSRGTPGFSGAELENLVNQAAVYAAVEDLKYVTMEAFEHAKDKILMGEERKSAVLSPATMKCTAYHEAGHAVIALLTDGAEPVHKATIMPRGRALGMVMQLPEGDQTSLSLKEMFARLDVCMAGRVAEEMFFGKENVTSGASSDIQQATNLARSIVSNWGLSEKIGPMLIDSNVSGNLKNEADKEMKRILDESYQRCKTLMEKNKHVVETVALSLLEHETLSGREIADLTKGIKVDFDGKRSQGPSRPISIIPPFERKKKSNPDKLQTSSSGSGGGAGRGETGSSGGSGGVSVPSPLPAASLSLKADLHNDSNSSNNSNSSSSPHKAVQPKPAAPASSSSSIRSESKVSEEVPLTSNDTTSSATSTRIRGPPKL